MSTIVAGSRHDLTDAQWAVLEPLLPTAQGSGRGRPRRWCWATRWMTTSASLGMETCRGVATLAVAMRATGCG